MRPRSWCCLTLAIDATDLDDPMKLLQAPCRLITLLAITCLHASAQGISPNVSNIAAEPPSDVSSDLTSSESDGDALAFCGVAAVEFIGQRFGIAQLKGIEYERLNSQRIASLYDLRSAFEANGLSAESYQIAVDNSKGWKTIAESLNHGVIQVVVLVDTDQQGGTVDHFLVITNIDGEMLELVDPRSMSIGKTTLNELFPNTEVVPIQIVSLTNSKQFFEPLRLDQWFTWAILPVMALLSLIFLQKKTSVARE